MVLQEICLYEIIGGMLLTCQNTTMRVYRAWIKPYYVLCPKHIAALCVTTVRGAHICETGLFHQIKPNNPLTPVKAVNHSGNQSNISCQSVSQSIIKQWVSNSISHQSINQPFYYLPSINQPVTSQPLVWSWWTFLCMGVCVFLAY